MDSVHHAPLGWLYTPAVRVRRQIAHSPAAAAYVARKLLYKFSIHSTLHTLDF